MSKGKAATSPDTEQIVASALVALIAALIAAERQRNRDLAQPSSQWLDTPDIVASSAYGVWGGYDDPPELEGHALDVPPAGDR